MESYPTNAMTSLFSAQYSTLSSVALQGYLIKAYRLKADTSCRLLIRNVSDTYILEDKTEKYIFKIYRDSHRSICEIEAEVELLNILKSNGLPISYPLKDAEGKQIQQFNAIEGIRNGILFSYAKGKVIQDLEPQHLHRLGKDIATIHQATANLKLKNKRAVYNFETTLFLPLKTLEIHFKEMPEEYLYLQDVANKVVKKFETFDTANFSYGYCHYDFFPKNFHFDNFGNITFFDFDFAGEGYLINDLMSFLNHYFFHGLNGLISKEQAERDFNLFLNAYTEVRALTDDEKKAIPYLGICFHIFFLEFFYKNYDDWSNIFLTPKYTKNRVALIKKWVEMYCEI